jgi:hypothetical protein
MDSRHGIAEQMKRLPERLKVLEPALEDHRIHVPMWTVAATRVD